MIIAVFCVYLRSSWRAMTSALAQVRACSSSIRSGRAAFLLAVKARLPLVALRVISLLSTKRVALEANGHNPRRGAPRVYEYAGQAAACSGCPFVYASGPGRHAPL
jgi:hypothetical protein